MEKQLINESIHNWVNNNQDILSKHKNMWIAYNVNGIVAADEDYQRMISKATASQQSYIIYSNHHFGKVRFI
jgi:hypothetical protein